MSLSNCFEFWFLNNYKIFFISKFYSVNNLSASSITTYLGFKFVILLTSYNIRNYSGVVIITSVVKKLQ